MTKIRLSREQKKNLFIFLPNGSIRLPHFGLPRQQFRRPGRCGLERLRLEQCASLGVERERVVLVLRRFLREPREHQRPCVRFPRSLRAGIRDREATDFYPASGCRASYSGSVGNVGSYGFTWSSSPHSASGVLGTLLGFFSSVVSPEDYNDRSRGFPVRCVQLCVSREQRPFTDFAEAKKSGASNGGVMDKRGAGQTV